jgi:hypothetical protein
LPDEGRTHVASDGKVEILCCDCEDLGKPENLQAIEKAKLSFVFQEAVNSK